jgi:hypothetical protein
VFSKVDGLLDQLTEIIATKVGAARIRRAVVRSMLTCNTINVVDSHHIFVAAQKSLGMPSTMSLYHPTKSFSLQDIYDAARWEFGFDSPFVIQLPSAALDQTPDARRAAIEAVADEHIRSEIARAQLEMNVVPGRQRSSGRKPVCFAIRASIRGPISSSS